MSHSSYSYSFPDSPKRCRQASFIENFTYQIRLMNYRYEITFSAYVLTPGEKLVMNSIILLFTSLMGYALLSCLTTYIHESIRRILLSYAISNDQPRVTMGGVSRTVVGNTSSAWSRIEDTRYGTAIYTSL